MPSHFITDFKQKLRGMSTSGTLAETDSVEVGNSSDAWMHPLSGFVLTTLAQTVAGAKTFSDLVTFSTMFKIPVATVAAAGTVQADAASITTGFTLVTGADDAKGVKLPAAAAGLVCIIKVGDGADLKVWPATGDAINAIAANSAMTVVDDVCFALIALDATTWYTLPLLPS